MGQRIRPIPGYLSSRGVLIRRLDRRSRLAALASALELADEQEAGVFAAELVDLLGAGGRPQREPVSVAARLFAQMPAQARSAAVCVAREALIKAGEALDPGETLARRSKAALAGATAAPGLCRHLPQLLLDRDPEIVKAAEQAVAQIADAATTSPDRGACERALVEAVASFDQHRRRSVLVAGLRVLGTPAGLAGAGETSAEWLADSTHPANLALRALLRREQGAEIARAALVWLRVPAQAPACRERLLTGGSVEERGEILRLAHLMEHPARSRALALQTRPSYAREAPQSGIDAAALIELPTEARRQLPRWLASIAPDSRPDAAVMAALAADPAPIVRLAAITNLQGGSDAPELLDLGYDDEPSVARSAALRIANQRSGSLARHAGDPGRATIERLQRSPHQAVRAIARARASQPHDPGERAALRLALRRDRKASLAEIRDGILMGDIRSRVAWMRACRPLGIAPDLERDLCDVAEEFMDEPERTGPVQTLSSLTLAATAVGALSDCAGDRSAGVLRAALKAPDPRVVANAVEAIGRRARRAPLPAAACLVEFKDTPAHRARANAALALLRIASDGQEDAAGVIMKSMLADERPPHRLAGLWLAERAASGRALPIRSVIEPVNALRDDADANVRDRAARCRRRLGVLAGLAEVAA